MIKNTTNRIEEIDSLINSFNEQVKSLKKEKQKILKEVEGKPKASFTKAITSILKKYNFYKLEASWVKDYTYDGGELVRVNDDQFVLTIGIQPEGHFNKDFDQAAAANNYEKIVEEVNKLDLVKKANKGSYYVGMGGKMSGLLVTVDRKKLLAA
jgi:hypothetical protein